VDIDWRKGIIKRQPSIKDYVEKLAKGELWPKIADDWRRMGLSIQTKYHQVNSEYQKLVAQT
jgi:hypothetical protein